MTCIHLGLPKAASTTLQRHLFATHSQIECLCKGGYGPEFGKAIMNTISRRLPKCDDDTTLEMWRRSVIEIVAPAMLNGRVPVLSREGLVASNHAKLAVNIERVFGPSKVILVVRHPLRWVESHYIQLLWARNLKEWKPPIGYFTFEDWITKSWAAWNKKGRGALLLLMSRKILEPYVARFGRQSVGVFMFEHLESDPQGFIEAMCEFIGVDPVEGVLHAADKHRQLRITRDTVEGIKLIHRSSELTRRFRLGTRKERSRMIGFRRSLLHAKDERATVEIPDRWRARIEDLVRDDCNYLRQEWGLPVREAGYPL